MNSPKEVLEAGRMLKSRIGAVEILHSNTTSTIKKLRKEHKNMEMMKEIVDVSRESYQRVIEHLYEESLKEIEEVLNASLGFVFWDKQFNISLKLGNTRSKTLTIQLTDPSFSPPLLVDIKEGVGRGVRTVVSFVLHVYFILNKGGSRTLFVDEQYGHVSEEYTEKFYQFMKSLAKEKDIKLVMISHESEYSHYADTTYMVSDGFITEVQS